jgi:hypothetical protein
MRGKEARSDARARRAYAVGMSAVFFQTTLKKTGPNFYVIGCP